MFQYPPSKTKVARSKYGNRWQAISGICTYLHAPTHAADFERTSPPPPPLLKPIEKLSHPENICYENGPHRFSDHRKRIPMEASGHLVEEGLLITDLTMEFIQNCSIVLHNAILGNFWKFVLSSFRFGFGYCFAFVCFTHTLLR